MLKSLKNSQIFKIEKMLESRLFDDETFRTSQFSGLVLLAVQSLQSISRKEEEKWVQEIQKFNKIAQSLAEINNTQHNDTFQENQNPNLQIFNHNSSPLIKKELFKSLNLEENNSSSAVREVKSSSVTPSQKREEHNGSSAKNIGKAKQVGKIERFRFESPTKFKTLNSPSTNNPKNINTSPDITTIKKSPKFRKELPFKATWNNIDSKVKEISALIHLSEDTTREFIFKLTRKVLNSVKKTCKLVRNSDELCKKIMSPARRSRRKGIIP